MGSAASPPPASGSPARCVFFNPKKKRRCGMCVKPGATLCGNHARDGDDGARVECEHCKTRVTKLASHLRRCPALLHKVEQASQPYFVLDVNAGEDDPEDARSPTSDDATPAPPRATMPRGDELRRLARRAMDACRAAGVAPDAPAPEPISTPPCDLAMRVQEAACARAAQGGGGLVAPFNRRHAEQHASIVSHMVSAGLAGSRDADANAPASDAAPSTSRGAAAGPVYVELGAGRGYLAHFLLDAYGPADLLMVERKSYRFKAERGIGAAAAAREAEAAERAARSRAAAGAAAGISISDAASSAKSIPDHVVSAEERAVLDRRAGSTAARLRVDIKDLRLSGADVVSGRDVVVLGKHLCGAATDLALRCLLETEPDPGFDPTGVAIATCCHHRCEWRTYVNRGFFRRLGFDGDDFARLAKLSSWACLDQGDGENEHAGTKKGVKRDAKRAKTNETKERTEEEGRNDDEENDDECDDDDDAMTKEEKIRLGRMIKSLVDQGRLEYLRSRGMEGRVVGYVEPTTSPENRLLVARASGKSER